MGEVGRINWGKGAGGSKIKIKHNENNENKTQCRQVFLGWKLYLTLNLLSFKFTCQCIKHTFNYGFCFYKRASMNSRANLKGFFSPN